MRGLVLLVLLDAPEVPLYCLFVVLHHFVVHPYVVVAGGVLGTGLTCLLVPTDSVKVYLLGSSIDNANLIEGSCIRGMVLSHLRQNLYFSIRCGLIPTQNEQADSAVGFKFKKSVGHFL